MHVAPFHVTVCSFRCLPAVHSCQRLKMGFNNNRSYWHIFWFTTVSLFIIEKIERFPHKYDLFFVCSTFFLLVLYSFFDTYHRCWWWWPQFDQISTSYKIYFFSLKSSIISRSSFAAKLSCYFRRYFNINKQIFVKDFFFYF